jgi:hypothetical protein
VGKVGETIGDAGIDADINAKAVTLTASKLMICKIGARGFEPPTSRSQTERSTKLSHAPTGRQLYTSGV